MIGQDSLRATITRQIKEHTFPRFSILVGPKGSGRRTICGQIAAQLNALVCIYDTGVDSIREMIEDAYKVSDTMLYVIPDGDNMSLAAKNALLKVTEEPPRNAYFILTLQSEQNTLNTIKSRGTIFRMDPYSFDDLYDIAIEKYCGALNPQELDIVANLCETPLEVMILKDCGVIEFWEYVNKVVDNIAVVSGSNSFKIANRICFKDAERGKYDLKIFWKAFMSICANRMKEDPLKYANGVKITSKYLQELRITGINKQSTFDCWLLDIRQEWL